MVKVIFDGARASKKLYKNKNELICKICIYEKNISYKYLYLIYEIFKLVKFSPNIDSDINFRKTYGLNCVLDIK